MEDGEEFLSCTREWPSYEKNVHSLAAYTQGSDVKGCMLALPKVSPYMTLLAECTLSTCCTIVHALPIHATLW
jgi:hypothetical protein